MTSDRAKFVDETGRTHYLEHHHTLINSAESKLKVWEEAVHGRELECQRRCGECWLRKHQCYCDVLARRRDMYASEPCEYAPEKTEIIIYYAFKEIGRGPNTAHIMEKLLPPETTSRVILGFPQQEKKLIDDLVEEYQSHAIHTCIMYPSKEAQLVSTWKEHAVSFNEQSRNEGEGDSVDEVRKGSQGIQSTSKTRLIVLDGTYSDARRMYNYLKICLQARGVPCPAVKLDIGEEGFIKSAYLGIMDQPGRDKICTFQAAIMAMSDLGEPKSLCNALNEDLTGWIHYLLQCRIKTGKEDIKVPSDLYEASYTDGGGMSSHLKQATQKAFAPPSSIQALHREILHQPRGQGRKERIRRRDGKRAAAVHQKEMKEEKEEKEEEEEEGGDKCGGDEKEKETMCGVLDWFSIPALLFCGGGSSSGLA